MKKFCRYIFVLGICILFGIGIGTFVTEFEMDKLFELRINYAAIIGLFALSMLFSTTLHELSHAFYFWINKIPLRFIAVFLFCFYKDDKRWKFLFYPNKITLAGGIVIPDLPAINSEGQFEKIRKIYSRALLFAPIISFVEAIAAMVAYAVLLFSGLSAKYIYISVFLVFCIFIGLTMFVSSFLKTENLYGDFPAYKLYKENDKRTLLQLAQYLMFANDWKQKIMDSGWLVNEIFKYAKKTNAEPKDSTNLGMLDWVIQLEYLGVFELDDEINGILRSMFEEDKILSEYPQSEERDIFYFHMVYRLLKDGQVEKRVLQEVMNRSSEKLLKGMPSKEYYSKLTKHLLYGCDDADWLNKNMNPSSSFTLLGLFEPVREVERRIIQQKLFTGNERRNINGVYKM